MSPIPGPPPVVPPVSTPTEARQAIYDALVAARTAGSLASTVSLHATATYSGKRGREVVLAPGGMDPEYFYVIVRCYATNDARNDAQADIEDLYYSVDQVLPSATSRPDWSPRSDESGVLWMEARVAVCRDDF